MLILSLDSTARVGSAALLDDEKPICYTSFDNGLSHSELLLPAAEQLLRESGKTMDDLDLLACNVGPGSFTGVRIGVAVIKGLAFGREIPIAPVSTLHSLAENLYPLDGLYVPLMDARRNQVYNALFTVQNGILTRLTEDRAISLAALIEEIAEKYPMSPVRPVGDGTELFLAAATGRLPLSPAPILLKNQSAVSVGRIAYRMHLERKTVSDRELMPFYLRLPQAERERLEKASQGIG